jgi:hypothetical protein
MIKNTEIHRCTCTDLYGSVRALTCGVPICTYLYMILPNPCERAAPQAVGLGARTGGSGWTRTSTRTEGSNMVDTEDPYYCPHCGVSPCAGLTEDCG